MLRVALKSGRRLGLLSRTFWQTFPQYPGYRVRRVWPAAAALADTEPVRANTQQTRQDKKRIRELERDVHRKNAALAETTALLVLAKKLSVIFQAGADA